MGAKQPDLLNTPVYPSLSGIKSIVAIASGKGGVGKSTVATNLAVALRSTGDRVGLLDADIYGPSQPGMLGATIQTPELVGNLIQPTNRYGIDFVSVGMLLTEDAPAIWRAPIAVKMINEFLGKVNWGQLDYLLIDLPPGTGDVQLTLAQQAALAGAVIITTPQQVALGVARRGLKMFQQVDVPIVGVIENMSGFTCRHCGETTEVFKAGGGRRMAGELGVPFLGSLPLDPEIMMSGDDGVPVLNRAPESTAAKAILELAGHFRTQVDQLGAEPASGPQHVEVNTAGILEVKWADGHESIHKPYNLRINCRCAGCVDEGSGEKTLEAARVPLDLSIRRTTPVGRYALAFEFSDGHRTGIYSFDLLRALCECDVCSSQRRKGEGSFSV
jgi:ATP-binding protein involved in chromosome partitioning